MAVNKILSLASGNKNNDVEIYEGIDFVMTYDSTTHNLGVIQEVGDDLAELTNVSSFQHSFSNDDAKNEVFGEIHNALGK